MDLDNVVLYSTGCPNCKILKKKMDEKGIAYTENNSVNDMISLGLTNVPVLKINGNLYGFKDAVNLVQSM